METANYSTWIPSDTVATLRPCSGAAYLAEAVGVEVLAAAEAGAAFHIGLVSPADLTVGLGSAAGREEDVHSAGCVVVWLCLRDLAVLAALGEHGRGGGRSTNAV